jgi:hypothetical protein
MYFATTISILVSLLTSTMAVSNYEGVYSLTKVLDANMGEIPIPSGDFKVRMQAGKVANQYDMGVKLGNMMGSSVTVTDSDVSNKDAVTISGMRSTMMMPPENIFKVEVALSDILPAANLIHLEDNDNLLVIEGPKGTVQCTRNA